MAHTSLAFLLMQARLAGLVADPADSLGALHSLVRQLAAARPEYAAACAAVCSQVAARGGPNEPR